MGPDIPADCSGSHLLGWTRTSRRNLAYAEPDRTSRLRVLYLKLTERVRRWFRGSFYTYM